MKENIVRGSIEYIGINTDIPDNINIFRIFNLCDTIENRAENINIEEIIQVVTRISILEYNLMDTAEGSSIDGQKLTGKKLIVEGVCESKIQYLARNKNERKLETLRCNMPFCEYIVVPSRCTKGNLLDINVYINDISVRNSIGKLILSVSGILTADIK